VNRFAASRKKPLQMPLGDSAGYSLQAATPWMGMKDLPRVRTDSFLERRPDA